MSIEKNPAIDALAPDSLCYNIYRALYAQFFNAQDRKDAEHPWGVEEGDDTSVRLHNTAYGFALAIAGAVGGNGGGEGGILMEYLRLSGGDMQGLLRACYGFAAGVQNRTLLEAYAREDGAGVRFAEEVDVRGGILLCGRRALSYDVQLDRLNVQAPALCLGDTSVLGEGSILVGDAATGVRIDPSGISVGGRGVYHGGNANRSDADWTMRDATVAGALHVAGAVELSGTLRALHGVELGVGGGRMLLLRDDELAAGCHLSFDEGYGIRMNGQAVLIPTADGVRLSGAGGNLLLGGGHTGRVRLLSAVMDADDSYTLLSPHGEACFPGSLTVRHDFGDTLLSSYRTDAGDEGVTIHKRLRLGSAQGPYLCPQNGGIALFGTFERTLPGSGKVERRTLGTTLRYLFSAEDTLSDDAPAGVLSVESDAAALVFEGSLRTRESFGIAGSATRLASDALFFSDDRFLLGVADGIKHFGNTYLLGDVSSELFTSGFAGTGWAVRTSRATGNAAATFDELTVRKRMRVYELEIRKADVVGGGLWVSDCCRGDTVERIH